MVWFGRNLSASAFGVGAVWMNMLRAPRGATAGNPKVVRSIGLEFADIPSVCEVVCANRAALYI